MAILKIPYKNWIVALIFTSTLCLSMFMLTNVYTGNVDDLVYNWILRLTIKLACCGAILLPGLAVLFYVKVSDFNEDSSSNCLTEAIKAFFYGDSTPDLEPLPNAEQQPSLWQGIVAGVCVFIPAAGKSYLVEKIMTQTYENSNGEVASFPHSGFLVFSSSFLVLVIALTGCIALGFVRPSCDCPAYKFSLYSVFFSLGLWCNFEGLKYVSFPAQTLAKSSKIIGVVIMNSILSCKCSGLFDWFVASVVLFGIALFYWGSPETTSSNATMPIDGTSTAIIMITLVCIQSGGLGIQHHIFQRYNIGPLQSVARFQLFSALFSMVSLIKVRHDCSIDLLYVLLDKEC